MILLSGHKVVYAKNFQKIFLMEMKIPQQVRAASGDPQRGAIPVELIRSQSFDEFPCIFAQKAGVSGTNRLDLGKEW